MCPTTLLTIHLLPPPPPPPHADELMFFSSVILPYQAVSVPELDAMVLDELDAACFPNATWVR